MNEKQLQLLNKMKKLVRSGHCRFLQRADRDYLSDIAEIGITVDEAWKIILQLNRNFYHADSMPTYRQSKDSLIFIRKINLKDVYIKLILEQNDEGEEVVCWSFHL